MGYALHVQDNIKENDYFRTTTGEIFKAVASKDGKVYYAFGEHYWVDSIAITDFKENIKDLMQAGDMVLYTIKGLEHSTYIDIVKEYADARTLKSKLRVELYSLEQINIKKILTKEKFESECFKVEEGQDV